MTPAEIEQLVAAGLETRSVEFKQAGSWADVGLRGKLIRTALSLANTRDGGVIVVGMKSDPGHPGRHLPDPLTDEQRASFDPDVVVPRINAHAAPFISVNVLHHTLKTGEALVAISIDEFRDYPVLCVQDVSGDGQRLLVKKGAILVRSGRMAETTEIQSLDDLRELIELAVDKGLASYFRRQEIDRRTRGPGNNQLFSDELGDLAK